MKSGERKQSKLSNKHLAGSGFFIALIFVSANLIAQDKKITPDEYIKTYKDLAVSEMVRTGIPASITLAQGMLESGTGNSPLATQGNNHFGIKCKSGWTGKTINVDDDDLQECFRAYDKAEDSYKDHSDFLAGNTRYAFLFKIDPTDYKSWAYGLRQAGYATNPKYPELVITNIEKYSLYQYDIGYTKKDNIETREKPKETFKDIFEKPEAEPIKIKYNNLPAYEVKPGDTYASIADAHGMMRWELRKYNDLLPDEQLKPGVIIYLKPKRRRAKEPYHTVQEGEGMYTISQKEAIKQRMLYKWNRMEKDREPETGDTLYMRHKRPNPAQLKPAGTVMPRNGITQDGKVEHLRTIQKEDVMPQPKKIIVPKDSGVNLDGKDSFGNYHLARESETVYGISKTYNVLFADLIEWNHVSGPLHTGQKIYITKPTNYQPKSKTIHITNETRTDDNGIYIVQRGETLYSISKKFHVPVDSLKRINKLKSTNLYDGQTLIVQLSSQNTSPGDQTPTMNDGPEYHIVTSGETLYSISKKYNVSIADLVDHNNLKNNSISIGQRLVVKW